ncbi:MAG: outer membrane protein assembly factor BamD [Bacteroidia bacterium]|nr:outer membrane protein assembly factor BamD [Bacteroidia bacterium]
MKRFTFPITFILLVASLSTSCDPYTKLMKTGSVAEKDSAAMRYYNKKKYDKAVYLFDELRGIYRGTPRARDVYYYYTYCRYHLGELVSASYYFDDFARQYPRDPKVQEMKYMQAYCSYLTSDPWYLDQKFTYAAIEQLQIFIDTYPESEKTPEANKLMTELREKLAEKAFEQARLYYKIGYSKAAMESFNTMIEEFPDSKYREEGQYLLFRSAVNLSQISVQSKKRDRLEEALNYYEKFVDKYPNSKFVKDAESSFSSVQKEYQKLMEIDQANNNSSK